MPTPLYKDVPIPARPKFRTASQYEYDCTECGTPNVTTSTSTQCGGCGVTVRLEWRAAAGADTKPAPEPTISAAYDGNGHGLPAGSR